MSRHGRTTRTRCTSLAGPPRPESLRFSASADFQKTPHSIATWPANECQLGHMVEAKEFLGKAFERDPKLRLAAQRVGGIGIESPVVPGRQSASAAHRRRTERLQNQFIHEMDALYFVSNGQGLLQQHEVPVVDD